MARKKAVISTSREILEPRVYELGFLLSPAIREEDLDARVSEIQDIITQASGTIVSDAKPEFIDLAYEMARVIENKRVRFTQGYFGWIKFTLDPGALAGVKEAIEKKAYLIRMILIQTVMENTVISKKPLSKVLKSSVRDTAGDDVVAEEVVVDSEADTEDVDLGIAAAELQTPVNEANEDADEAEVEPSEDVKETSAE